MAFFSGVHVTSSDKSKIAEVAARPVTAVNALPVSIGPGDPISDIPVMIDFDHHQIHEGESFAYLFYGAVNSASKDFRLVVPNVAATTRTPHLIWEVVADAAALALLYEAPTWTAGGVAAGVTYNKNRNSASAPGTVVYVTGGTALTVNALGTLIDTGMIFSGKFAAGGQDRALMEWVLKSNTEYLFRVTTTGNTNVIVRLHWYEDRGGITP
jgi:hypothetical protein